MSLPWDIVIILAVMYLLACLIIATVVSEFVHVATEAKVSLAARYRQFRQPRQTCDTE